MDRFPGIKRKAGKHVGMSIWQHPMPLEVHWLIDEVERLRERLRTKVDQVEYLNRSLIDECKRQNRENDRLRADVAHLEKTNAQMGTEHHRLRNIEDAVLAIEALPPGRDKVLAYIALTETLRANPRPEKVQ